LQIREQLRADNIRVGELRAQRATVLQSSQALQDRRQEIVADKDSISKKLAGEEILIERARAQLHDTLQKAQVEEVALPAVPVTEKGALPDGVGASQEAETADSSEADRELIWHGSHSQFHSFSQPLVDLGDSRKDSSSNPSEGESSDQRLSSNKSSKPVTESTHFSQALNPTVLRDSRRMSKVDLSSMARFKNLSKQKMLEKEKELNSQITELANELDSMQPNMHAVDRFAAVQERLGEASNELEAHRERVRQATAQFEEVRRRRLQMFQECYKHVSESLSVIYKDLTRSSKHPLGGTAYLTLDNQDEPYLGGVRFTAMPPLKRFRDMDQLSGGEKTMAALALLFSIYSYRQAPFFVLDEVDAALDNVNVKKIVNYIRQRSQDFQCVVISLKEMFFEHADCLVGICKDVQSLSSRILTLDLTQYGETTTAVGAAASAIAPILEKELETVAENDADDKGQDNVDKSTRGKVAKKQTKRKK